MMTHEFYGGLSCLSASYWGLQGYVHIKVQIDIGFSLTNVLADSTHTFQRHSCKDNVRARKGKVIRKDNRFSAGCDTQGIDQGQYCLHLVLAAPTSTDQCLSVYDALKYAFPLSDFCSQGHRSSILYSLIQIKLYCKLSPDCVFAIVYYVTSKKVLRQSALTEPNIPWMKSYSCRGNIHIRQLMYAL